MNKNSDKINNDNDNENITNSAYIDYLNQILYYALYPVNLYSLETLEKYDKENIIKKDSKLINKLNEIKDYYIESIKDYINELNNSYNLKEKLQIISDNKSLLFILEKLNLNKEEYKKLKNIGDDNNKYFKDILLNYMKEKNTQILKENENLKEKLNKFKNKNKINFINK